MSQSDKKIIIYSSVASGILIVSLAVWLYKRRQSVGNKNKIEEVLLSKESESNNPTNSHSTNGFTIEIRNLENPVWLSNEYNGLQRGGYMTNVVSLRKAGQNIFAYQTLTKEDIYDIGGSQETISTLQSIGVKFPDKNVIIPLGLAKWGKTETTAKVIDVFDMKKLVNSYKKNSR